LERIMALYSRTDNEAQRRKVGATTELNSVTTDPAQDPADQPQAKVIQGQYIYIDDTEATIPANKARGLTAPGWWKYYTYTDAAGKTRHKAEHLVAFKDAPTVTADTDDRYAADAIVTLTLSTVANQTTTGPAGGILTVDTIAAADALREAGTYTIAATDYITDAAGEGATFTVVVNGSGAATVTVDDAGSGFVVDETITIDDADLGGGGAADLTFDVATVASGAATFSVTATGTGTKYYQWQSQTANGTKWSNISGATSASLALTGLTTSDSGKKYRVKVTSAAGAPEAISNTATLTVNAA
jgi:hypothetical protein